MSTPDFKAMTYDDAMVRAGSTVPREFHCPRWPGCQCPDGTIAADCPGRTLPAASASGGPAAAPHTSGKASPAAAAIDPDAAVTGFRQALAARRGRRISGEKLIADINVLLARGDRCILEVSAIQTELAMIRADMAELHGLPIEPPARKAR